MLEEIMRRGTSSFGVDVSSEREINRLVVRLDEEFWLFEKMDEERRLKENYRFRFMEDYEVFEWVYIVNVDVIDKGKGFDYVVGKILGKRKRKEVVYVDILSDLRWVKVMENGEDLSKYFSKRKRKDYSFFFLENYGGVEENNNGYEVGNDDDVDVGSLSEGKSEEIR